MSNELPATRLDSGRPPFPATGRLAGIDFGTVRVGVALCDPGRSVSSPHDICTRRNEQLDAEYFRRLVRDYQVVGFVIGLPLHTSGHESQKSEQARQFARWLQAHTGIPYVFVDERYSTRMARALMEPAHFTAKKKKSRMDKIAAQIILATFLENPSLADANVAEEGEINRSLDDLQVDRY